MASAFPYAPFESNSAAEAACTRRMRVNMMGDVYLSSDYPAPSAPLFAGVAPLLRWADFNVANFEGVVTRSQERAYPDFPFALRMHPATPAFLAEQGIRYVTRANNHSMDYGLVGMRDTDAALRSAGVRWTGVGENITASLAPLVLERDGIRLGILAFTTTYPDGAWASDNRPGVPFPTEGRLRAAIEKLRPEVDFVLTVFHWGEEKSALLKPHQPELARIALEAGADAVFGHHAHVAQAVERVNGKWAVYGLGNFVFHSNSTAARLGLLASLELCRNSDDPGVRSKLALAPLDTFNQRTGFATRPMTPAQFAAFAKPYFKQGLFTREAPFRPVGPNDTSPSP